ncbi:hypothetical protein RhiirC2_861916 [Rhizophagus irregularis]|uniref:PLP-dependent transferase n=1 Tax=Rhizophagus irregularis TaxID=588596 RepID=A0A2N1NU90_9GLOM|nr:hypothetical protein RhiirC2_861916 [Rhizophagus irregularis]
MSEKMEKTERGIFVLRLFNCTQVILPKLGINVKFVQGDDPEEFAKLINDKPKAIYLESMRNLKFNIPDFEAICEYFIKPIVRGADIVVHMQRNNGTTIRGVVIDEEWIWMYLAFGVKGDANVGAAFIDALQLASERRKNSRDTSCFNDTSTINGRRQLFAGVNKKMIRLTRFSVGYEHIDDIKEDFTIAFEKIKEIN